MCCGTSRFKPAVLLLALAFWPALAGGSEGPRRICSVSLAGDELISLLVPAERVVCVSAFADDPALSNVSGLFPEGIRRLTAQIEPVLAARPDLVLVAPWNDPGFLNLLRRTGIPTFVLEDVSTFEGIRRQVRTLGNRLGEPGRAREVAREMDRRLSALKEALAGVEARPRVISFAALVVAGKNTTVDEVIARAGGLNGAAALGVEGHQQVSAERLLAADPDVWLLGLDPGVQPSAALQALPQLQATRAVRQGRIVSLPSRLLTTVSPFLVEGAEHLARQLHPEAAARLPERSFNGPAQ